MATINGRSSYANGHYTSNFYDVLESFGSDSINGLGGNDTIYAGGGQDIVNGGSGNDYLLAGHSSNPWLNGNYGNDYVYGGSGDDTINYSWSRDSAYIWGDSDTWGAADGNDTIWGSQSGDWIYGGAGSDTLNGWDGNDVIYGDYHNDTGGGGDTITGGLGMDRLYSGVGDDLFVYNYGDSPATYAGSDIIHDFNGIHDNIWTPGAVGTTANYAETTFSALAGATQAEKFALAAHRADYLIDISRDTSYVFLTDGQNGYLFADTNMDNNLDFGIELEGLTSTTQFSHWDLV